MAEAAPLVGLSWETPRAAVIRAIVASLGKLFDARGSAGPVTLLTVDPLSEPADDGAADEASTAQPAAEPDTRCAADWRRPEGYWRCARVAGHRGRHKMRAEEMPISG